MPVELAIHDEGGFPPTKAFLGQFLPVAASTLGRYLGRWPAGVVHVILSDKAAHEARFPARTDQLLPLIEESELEELAADERGVERAADESYSRSFYAHGVATRVRAEHGAPSGAVVGEHGIYLDIGTIEELATTLDVPVEGMLAKVASHELAHVFRGHADANPADSPTHGWFSEGDAQRDCWHVLAELIPDDVHRQPARFGRAAQIRAADGQPAAYRQFPATPADWSSLARGQVLGPTISWTLMPVREVEELIPQRFVETPVDDGYASPSICDTVYLRSLLIIAGPWFVTGISEQPLLDQPRDRGFIEHRRREESFGSKVPTFKWLRLRAGQSLRAGKPTDEIPWSSALIPRRLESDAVVVRHLTGDGNAVARQLADENARDYAAYAERSQRGSPPHK